MMQHFTFIRHGESVGNLENRFQGQADFPLTGLGRSQAQAVAEKWRENARSFQRAISSPLLRARETAEIICAALQSPLEFDQDWMEIDNGLISGLSVEEAMQNFPKPPYLTPYTRYGQTGESRWQLYLRAGRAIQHLLDHPAESTLIVAHGGILNMALYAILGIQPQADHSGARFQFHNTGYADFLYDPVSHSWRMLSFNGHPCGKDAWA